VTSGLGKPENVHSRTADCSTLTTTSAGLPSTFGLPLKKDYVNNDEKKQEKHTANCERTSCFNWLSSTIIRNGFVHTFEKKRSVKKYSKIKIYQHQFDQYD
jgi:hypothetical protein